MIGPLSRDESATSSIGWRSALLGWRGWTSLRLVFPGNAWGEKGRESLLEIVELDTQAGRGDRGDVFQVRDTEYPPPLCRSAPVARAGRGTPHGIYVKPIPRSPGTWIENAAVVRDLSPAGAYMRDVAITAM